MNQVSMPTPSPELDSERRASGVAGGVPTAGAAAASTPAGPSAAGVDPLAGWPLTGVRLVSFDVFDTVLARRVGEPSHAFLRVGERLRERGVIDASAEAFAAARYAAEKRVRRNEDNREVTLAEVYHELTHFSGLESAADAMAAVECEVERGLIAPIPAMRERVGAARRRFGRVVYVSDMYHDASFVEGLLREHGLLGDDDAVYVSSTHGVQKGDGRLLRIVLGREGLAPGELLHVGNSLRYDVAPARRLGIGVAPFPEGNPAASEAVLNRFAHATDGFTSELAGAARLARLGRLDLEAGRRAAWDTGASVTGPLVYLYARWLLGRARRLGITQLLFLARDAFLPCRAVDAILADHPEWGVHTAYLYGSRVTYFTLGVDRLDDEAWAALTEHGRHRYRSPRDLQAALHASDEAMAATLAAAGLSGADRGAALDDAGLAAFRRASLEDASCNGLLSADLRRCQDVQRRYLHEQGATPDRPTALVDTGWTTRSHAPLFDFLAREGYADLRMFYLGLIVEKTRVPVDRVETFMFNRALRRGAMFKKVEYPRCLETLFTSSHGRTSGFDEADGRVVPRFEPVEDPGFVERYFDAYLGGFDAFLREAAVAATGPAKASYDLRAVAEAIVRRLWTEPTPAEAALWSRLTWEWDPQGRVTYRLARPYRLADAWPAFAQRRPPAVQEQFWAPAAVALTPRGTMRWIEAAIVCRRAFDRLGRLMPRGLGDRLTRWRRGLIEPNRGRRLD